MVDETISAGRWTILWYVKENLKHLLILEIFEICVRNENESDSEGNK